MDHAMCRWKGSADTSSLVHAFTVRPTACPCKQPHALVEQNSNHVHRTTVDPSKPKLQPSMQTKTVNTNKTTKGRDTAEGRATSFQGGRGSHLVVYWRWTALLHSGCALHAIYVFRVSMAASAWNGKSQIQNSKRWKSVLSVCLSVYLSVCLYVCLF